MYITMEYYGGAKRAPSAWNLFVKEHYAEVKHLAVKERLGALAQMGRQAGVIGNAKPSTKSHCASRVKTDCSGDCSWVVPKKAKKSGKPRSQFCRMNPGKESFKKVTQQFGNIDIFGGARNAYSTVSQCAGRQMDDCLSDSACKWGG